MMQLVGDVWRWRRGPALSSPAASLGRIPAAIPSHPRHHQTGPCPPASGCRGVARATSPEADTRPRSTLSCSPSLALCIGAEIAGMAHGGLWGGVEG
eukprot:3233588-Rhodomonas_salina.1